MVITYRTNLDELMEEQGRRNKWLAERLGVKSLSSVSLWRSGARPIPRRYVKQIADELGVTVEQLIIEEAS